MRTCLHKDRGGESPCGIELFDFVFEKGDKTRYLTELSKKGLRAPFLDREESTAAGDKIRLHWGPDF